MKKRIALIVMIIVLTLSVSTPAFADPLSDKLKKQQQQLQQNKNTYNDIINQIDQMESSIEILDEQIGDMLNQINDLKSKIDQTKKDIKVVEKNIRDAQKDIDEEQKLFDERMRVLYMNGSLGYIEILLNSTSFSDFLTRFEAIQKIMRYDRDLISSLKEKKEKINQEREELVRQNNKLSSLKAQSESKLQALNSKKSDQRRLISQLEAKKKYYASRIAQYQKDIEATKKQIAALKKKYANTSTAKYSGNAVVAYAMKFLGVKYVWGGNTPDGFDCSGFTKYVFAHFGKTLNRVSRDQATQGVAVSRDDLKPGDLVFFGNPIHHVGIYVGDNCFIHAPRTGDVVKISPLTRSDYNRARRIQ